RHPQPPPRQPPPRQATPPPRQPTPGPRKPTPGPRKPMPAPRKPPPNPPWKPPPPKRAEAAVGAKAIRAVARVAIASFLNMRDSSHRQSSPDSPNVAASASFLAPGSAANKGLNGGRGALA